MPELLFVEPLNNTFWTPQTGQWWHTFPDQSIAKLASSKHVIILLQYGGYFSTDHKLLDRFDCFKIVLINKSVILEPYPECLEHYDLVICYDGPTYADAIAGNDDYISDPHKEACIPEVYQVSRLVIENYVLPNLLKTGASVHLTTLEEEIVMQVAFLNQRYNFAGTKPEFAKYFVSKEHMIERARLIGAAPASIKFELDPKMSAAQMAQKLSNENELPPYPLFGKPVAGADSEGARKIWNEADLVAWISEGVNNSVQKYDNFLLQEFLDGDFFLTQTIVTNDGQLHLVCACPSVGSWASLVSEGVPAANLFLTEDTEEWQNLQRFSFRFLEAFQAQKHPGSYIIEVIRAKNGQFKLLETYYRPDNGPSENRNLELINGLDTEAIHILAPYIDSAFLKSLKLGDTRKFKSGVSIWYPRKAGRVKENRPITVELPNVSIVARTKYYNKPGDVTAAPYVSSDMCCELFILTETYEDALESACRCLKFDPVIVQEL